MDCVTVPATATSLFMNRPGSALMSPIFTRSQATSANPIIKIAMKYTMRLADIRLLTEKLQSRSDRLLHRSEKCVRTSSSTGCRVPFECRSFLYHGDETADCGSAFLLRLPVQAFGFDSILG